MLFVHSRGCWIVDKVLMQINDEAQKILISFGSILISVRKNVYTILCTRIDVHYLMSKRSHRVYFELLRFAILTEYRQNRRKCIEKLSVETEIMFCIHFKEREHYANVNTTFAATNFHISLVQRKHTGEQSPFTVSWTQFFFSREQLLHGKCRFASNDRVRVQCRQTCVCVCKFYRKKAINFNNIRSTMENV